MLIFLYSNHTDKPSSDLGKKNIIRSQKGYKQALFKLCANLIPPPFGLIILYLSTEEKVLKMKKRKRKKEVQKMKKERHKRFAMMK